METLRTIRPELLQLSSLEIQALYPYLSVLAGAILTLIAGVTTQFSHKRISLFLSFLTCLIGFGFSSFLLYDSSHSFFNGMWVSDGFSHFFNLLFLGAACTTILISYRYLDSEKLQYPEFYSLILFSALGMMLMIASMDLISIFISLEIMSLPIYVLVGFRRTDRRCNEAALKYFILGSAASAIMLYGSAFLYGCTTFTQIKSILLFVAHHPASLSPVFVLGVLMVSFGFLFKIAAVPFHMWMPDVYEGAPVPVTSFMTSAVKAASFGAFIRIFSSMGLGQGLPIEFEQYFHDFLWICAMLTMVGGNIVALTQTHLKRMLAYSSIAHSGYLLLGFLAAPQTGLSATVNYLVGYCIMNIGAFSVLALLTGKEDSSLNLHDLSGMGYKRPYLSFCFSIFLFSLAGIPPLVGFISKYLLFSSAIQANEILLVVIAALCSAISVYYYLRVIVTLYMREPLDIGETNERLAEGSWLTYFVVLSLSVLTLSIGLMPQWLIDLTKRVVAVL